MKMYKEVRVVFLPANTILFLQAMDQGIILSFKFYLRNLFHKARTAIDVESSY